MKNTFKRLMVLALVTVIAIVCVACSVKARRDTTLEDRFMTVEEDGPNFGGRGYAIKADKETGVMYLFCANNGSYIGITPLLNADGTPQLYDFGKEEDTETQPMFDNVTPLSDPASIGERGG